MISATLLKHMGDDLDVVNAARVSFNKTSKWGSKSQRQFGVYYPDVYAETDKLSDKDTKLIGYLAKHKHMSPFGHCFASFHVKAPIFVARQLVKHKFLRWNEVSRRYVDDEPEFYVPDVWRGRSADKKQGSDGVVKLEGVDEQIVDDYAAEALTAYQVLLEAGVAPEQSRMVLPQSTMTEWWWSGSLDAFADMCNLRRKEDTQYETRLVANSISMDMKRLFPISWGALVL
jgi:thymidylate synthase (FAD)